MEKNDIYNNNNKGSAKLYKIMLNNKNKLKIKITKIE